MTLKPMPDAILHRKRRGFLIQSSFPGQAQQQLRINDLLRLGGFGRGKSIENRQGGTAPPRVVVMEAGLR